jgi:hypothetical protein
MPTLLDHLHQQALEQPSPVARQPLITYDKSFNADSATLSWNELDRFMSARGAQPSQLGHMLLRLHGRPWLNPDGSGLHAGEVRLTPTTLNNQVYYPDIRVLASGINDYNFTFRHELGHVFQERWHSPEGPELAGKLWLPILGPSALIVGEAILFRTELPAIWQAAGSLLLAAGIALGCRKQLDYVMDDYQREADAFAKAHSDFNPITLHY